jgi:hypothetical protein
VPVILKKDVVVELAAKKGAWTSMWKGVEVARIRRITGA